MTRLKYIVSSLAILAIASPAIAGKLSDKEKRRLEADVRASESINRDRQDALRHLDRAHTAARIGDAGLKGAARRVPGGGVAYETGKKVGETGTRIYQKRKK